MAEALQFDLTEMLAKGWEITGYSTCLSQLGVITHHVLLRSGTDLVTATFLIQAGVEKERYLNRLSPAPPPKKKGFFG